MVHVFVTPSEARKLRNKINKSSEKIIQKQKHYLVSVNKEELEKLKQSSGRRKGVLVEYKGKKYRAFPRTPPTINPKDKASNKYSEEDVSEIQYLFDEFDENGGHDDFIENGSSIDHKNVTGQFLNVLKQQRQTFSKGRSGAD